MMGNRRRCGMSAWRHHVGLKRALGITLCVFIDNNGAVAVFTGTTSEGTIEFHWLVLETQVRIIATHLWLTGRAIVVVLAYRVRWKSGSMPRFQPTSVTGKLDRNGFVQPADGFSTSAMMKTLSTRPIIATWFFPSYTVHA
jgi:hypothetical protein